jgi:hypothetical protein
VHSVNAQLNLGSDHHAPESNPASARGSQSVTAPSWTCCLNPDFGAAQRDAGNALTAKSQACKPSPPSHGATHGEGDYPSAMSVA